MYSRGLDSFVNTNRFLPQQQTNPTFEDRLNAVGLNMGQAQDYADDRNFIQKALNLQSGNLLGGTLEILGRPQQAIMGLLEGTTNKLHKGNRDYGSMTTAERRAIDARDKEGILTSAWKGLSGQEKYYGGQAIRNVFKGGQLEDGSFDWTDVAGFGLDMLSDPMQWKMFSNSKGINQVYDKLGDTASATRKISGDLAGQAGSLTAKSGAKSFDDIVRQVNEITKSVDGLQHNVDLVKQSAKLKDVDMMQKSVKGLSEAAQGQLNFLQDYAGKLPKNVTHRSANQLLFDKVGDAIKPLGKWKDAKEAERMTSQLTKFLGDNAGEFAGGAIEKAANTADDLWTEISKSGTKLYEKGDEARMAIETIRAQASPQAEQFTGMIDELYDIVSKGKLPKELGFKTKEEFEKQIFNAYEYAKSGTQQTTMKDLVGDVLNGQIKKIPADNDVIKTLGSTFRDAGVNPKDVFSIVKSDGASYIKFNPEYFKRDNLHEIIGIMQKGVDGDALETIGDIALDLGKGYTNKEIRQFEKILDNPLMTELVNSVDDQVSRFQDIIGNNIYGYDHKMLDMTQEGYLPHTLNPKIKDMYGEVAESGTARAREETFRNYQNAVYNAGYNAPLKERKYPFPAEVANRLSKETYREVLDNPEYVAKVFKDNADGYELFKDTIMNQEMFTQDFSTTFTDLIYNKGDAMAYQKARADMVDTLFKGADAGERGIKGTVEFTLPNARTKKGMQKLTESEIRTLNKNLEYTDQFTGGGSKYLKNTMNEIKGAMGSGKKKDIAVDKRVHEILFGSNPTDADSVLKSYDKVMGQWKGLTVSNPSHLPKNEWQNFTNQYSAGMSPKDMVFGRKEAGKMMKKFEANGNELFKKLTEDGVNAFKEGTPERAFAEAFVDINKSTLPADLYSRKVGIDEAKGLFDEGKNVFSEAVDFLSTGGAKEYKGASGKARQFMDWQMDMNNRADMTYRISSHMAAKNNPNLYLKLGLNNPAEFAQLVHFDPNDLSFFEKDVLKRIFPFYTMKKKNIEFHLANVPKNIDRYARYGKAVDSLWGALGISDEERADYEIDGMMLPSITNFLKGGVGEDGSYRTMKWESPFADLADLTSIDGIKKDVVTSANPIIKNLVESATGVDAFTGRPVENYKGEASKNPLFKTKRAEQKARNLGIGGITKALGSLYSAGEAALSPEEVEKTFTDNILDFMNVSYQSNQIRNQEFKENDFNRAMRDYSRYMKETQGVEIPTAQELKKKDKATHDNILEQVRKEMEELRKQTSPYGTKKKKRS